MCLLLNLILVVLGIANNHTVASETQINLNSNTENKNAVGRDIYKIAAAEDDSASEHEDELNDYEGQSEIESLLEAVTDIIDRLYQFAAKIRNPRTRLLATKAIAFQKVDDETGIDLFKQFALVDKRHIEEKLDSYRLTRDNGEGQELPEDHEKTPHDRELNMKDNALIERLARANTLRRKQFGYWAKHYSKHIKETARALKDLDTRNRNNLKGEGNHQDDETNHPTSSKPLSRPTTATALLDPGNIKLDVALSVTSEITVSPQARQANDEQVDFPDPPAILKKKHFLCPYCFILCSQSVLEDKAWR